MLPKVSVIIESMRQALLIALLATRCFGYEVTGRVEPASVVTIYLHGATAPFESSAESGRDGRFRFRNLAAGTYTLAVSTAARGEALQTIELSPGTVDSKGRLDIVVKIEGRLESDGARTHGATISSLVLAIPERALNEYEAAQHCLSRRDVFCATGHLNRALQMAPRFAAAWNQVGTIAYQGRRYSDAEANFRKALAADAEAFEPLVNLGGVLLNLGRPREALEYNLSAVKRRPNDALANSQLGLTYFDLGDLTSAEKYLKVAVSLDRAHFSHPQLVLAEIYTRRGDRASAVAALKDFLEVHPDAPEAAQVRRELVAYGLSAP